MKIYRKNLIAVSYVFFVLIQYALDDYSNSIVAGGLLVTS